MLKHLASGGMADVVLGRSDGIEGFERHVVLKRIRPELARDQRFIRMFLDEARVVATLHHQNIVQVYDIGEASGEYFIAMEYVHGEDVRKILSSVARQRTHVPLGHAITIVSTAAAGLHYAHERRGSDKQPLNIVHRDVSPSNILVGYDGSIKVVDFGIASASTRQETRSGSLKGKLSYMSPEQCKGAMVDRRTDVYALGVMLYELATTTRMVKGENDYLVMEQIVTGRIPSPQFRRPGLPSELSEIIMRALATDRDRRFATADELRITLEAFATSAGLTASTSAIASFMRQQFGQRPEPWLELGPSAGAELDVPPPIDESVANNGWTEMPRTGRSGSIPRQSSPIGVIPGDASTEAATRADAPQRSSMASLSHTPPPTNSRLGWESQPRAPLPRSFPVQKAAIAAGAVAAGVAIWFVSRMVSSPAPQVAAPSAPALVAAAAVAPAPPMPTEARGAGASTAALAPTVVAAAPASAGTDPAARPSSSTRPEVSLRIPDTTPARKPRAAAVSTTSRAASRTETPAAPPPKPDRATPPAVAISTTTSARGNDAGTSDTELHRPVTAPPVPVPPPSTAPVSITATAPPPTPAAAPIAAQVVTPAALDANRIAGEKRIIPDEVTMDAISRSGQETLVSSYKVCVTADGGINSVTQLRSSGFVAYDDKIQSTIRKDWRYRPYLVNGKATPVCTAFRFIYSQK
jgi:serine/threonine protein kinase